MKPPGPVLGRNDDAPAALLLAARAWVPLAIAFAIGGCGISYTPEPIPPPFPSQSITLPVSGFEINYEPDIWNDGANVQYSTNCYAYALNMRTGFQWSRSAYAAWPACCC